MEENSTWIVASALGIWAFDNCDDAMEFGGELVRGMDRLTFRKRNSETAIHRSRKRKRNSREAPMTCGAWPPRPNRSREKRLSQPARPTSSGFHDD